MKAVVYTEFGSPDVLRTGEVPRPEPRRGEVLVRVRAAGVNFGDIMARSFRSVTPRGFNMPFLFWLPAKLAIGWRKPRIRVLGNEFSGDVVSAGREVTRFKPGDAVFGYTGERFGAHAEFIRLPENAAAALKPANLSYEEAAVIPYGAVMALALLRRVDLRPGRRILVNGASGGIGSAAVQIAKRLGADVTAVCGGPRLAYVRALGADRAIDYAEEDFTRGSDTYDVVLDVLGRAPISRVRRVLTPRGVLLCASFKGRHLLAMARTSFSRGRRVVCALAPGGLKDMLEVRELAEAGAIRAILDKRFPMEEAAEAVRYLESGRAEGKVALVM